MEILEKVQQYMVQKILLNEGVSIFRKHVHLFSQLKFSFVMKKRFFQSQDFRVSDFQCEFLWEKSVLDTVEAPMPRAFYDFPNKIIKCKCKWIHTSPAGPVEKWSSSLGDVYEKSSVFGARWSNPFGGSNATNPTHRAQKWTLQHHPFFGQKPNTSQSCDGFYFKPTFAAASFKAGKCEGAKKNQWFLHQLFCWQQ